LIFANRHAGPTRDLTRGQTTSIISLGAFIGLVALALRIHGLDAKPLWNDEAWSILITDSTAARTVNVIRQDYHPPLYYLTLYLWQQIGTGAAWARLLSALFGTAAAILLFMAGTLLRGPGLGFAAGLVLATGPLHVEWARVVRGYAELDFAVALALVGVAGLLAEDRVKGIPVWAWMAYVAGSAMALWIHNLAIFFVVGINAAVTAQWVVHWRRDRHMAMRWIIAQLALLVLFLPWCPSLIAQIDRLGAVRQYFIATRFSYYSDLESVFGIFRLWTLAPLSFACVVTLAAVGLVRGDFPVGGRRFFAILILVPVMVSTALFAAGVSFFGVVISKMVWIGVPYSIAVGAGIVTVIRQMANRRSLMAYMGVAVVAMAILLQVGGLRNLFLSPNPAWDQAALLTNRMSQPGDVVVDDPDDPAHSYNYYCALLGLDLPHVYPPDADAADLLRWVRQYRRVWVPVPLPTIPNRLPELVAAAEEQGMTIQKFSYRSLILYLLSVQNDQAKVPDSQ
jgi:uncharacterized membrane protein